jgi:cyclopropane fatty-acyl-phospholipid synthase-like methyltransferase
MKMTGLEKRFVNRRKKAENNIKKIRDTLKQLEVGNTKDVLEIGCGIGLVSAYLANQFSMKVYGTDFDPEEIKLAQEINEEGLKLHFQVEDAANLSFKDGSFDLVLSQNVFHHIPNWSDAVGEIQRVLRPAGCLIWHDIVFPGIVKKLFKPLTKNYGLYTIIDILSEFDKVGFTIIQKQKKVHGPFSHFQMVLTKS